MNDVTMEIGESLNPHPLLSQKMILLLGSGKDASSVFSHLKVAHSNQKGILGFFSLKEARVWRLVNRESLDEVKNFRWDDKTRIKNVENWHACFPRAINANFTLFTKPIDLSLLKNLQTLDLPTQIHDIDLNSLVNLRVLDMCNTAISNKSICKLRNLEKLRASFCENISDDFEGFPNLRVLDIGHTSVSHKAFKYFSNLTELDVSWNYHINDEAFDFLKNVQVLKVWHNIRLTSRALQFLPSTMKSLDVSYTGISDLHMERFKNLTYLDISGCNVSYECIRKIINSKMRLRTNDCSKPLRLLSLILR